MQCPEGFYPVGQKFADQCCEKQPGIARPCNPVNTANGEQESGDICADNALRNKPIEDGEQGPDVLDALQPSDVTESWDEAKDALAVETAVSSAQDEGKLAGLVLYRLKCTLGTAAALWILSWQALLTSHCLPCWFARYPHPQSLSTCACR